MLVLAIVGIGLAIGRTGVHDQIPANTIGGDVAADSGAAPPATRPAATEATPPSTADSGIAKPATSDPVAPAAAPPATALSPNPSARGTVTIETFGYSFGGPPDGARFVADVRNVEVSGFGPTENGLMPYVRERVMATSAAQEWLSVLRTRWMPVLKDGDLVAIGCAAGHHRSVSLAVVFAEDLRAQGYTVNLVHRDILRSY